MDLQLLPFITIFSLFVAGHGALSPEAYWNSVLPNTAMPKAIKDLLKPRGINVNVGHGSVGPHTWKVYKSYKESASKTQLQHSKTRIIFFLEEDLVPGKRMSLEFSKSDGDVTFLARSKAEKIPFLSHKMSEVFGLYNVIAGSKEGQTMMKTVIECEKPASKGEEKYCATSLESMVDFSTSKLGKNVKAISTELDKETKLQKYTITGVSKKNGNEVVACHKQPYPYAVFYCHYTHATKTYMVSLMGADGTKPNAVAVCHTDTSAWNPRHLAFQVLKVQPGTVPVCHYLLEDQIVWVAN